jgi:hypothetical protein
MRPARYGGSAEKAARGDAPGGEARRQTSVGGASREVDDPRRGKLTWFDHVLVSSISAPGGGRVYLDPVPTADSA